MFGQELPSGWAKIPLGDLMVETPNVVPAESPGAEFELWSVPALPTGKPEIAPGSDIGSNKQVVEPGDVLLCKINPRINRVWVVGPRNGQPQIASTEWIVLRSAYIDSRFLMHALRDETFRTLLCADVSGVGGSLMRARPQAVRKISIAIPPLSEQRRIAGKIDELQARSRTAREALKAIPPLLEKFRQSVLAAAFRGRLTAEWRVENPDVEPASVLLERTRAERRQRWEGAELEKMRVEGKMPKDDRWKEKYKEPAQVDASELPELPEGWAWERLDAVVDAERGIPYGIVQTGQDQRNGIPTVRCGDIKSYSIDMSTLKKVAPAIEEQYVRTRLRGGEVLIAIRGTVGATAVVAEDMAGMNISREVAMIPVLPGVDAEFVMYALSSPEVSSRVLGRVKGVAQGGINLADLRELAVPIAPVDEQSAILDRIRSAMTRSGAVQGVMIESEATADRFDQAMLAKAFRGELVPQDPNDEPASVLLERIREERSGVQPNRGRRARA